MHRIPDPAEFCAPEGGQVVQEAPPQLKVPRGETSWLGPIIGAIVVGAVVVLSYAAVVFGGKP
jgi:hypothetical protein